MRPAALDQRHVEDAFAPELVTKPGREFETAGAAADNDDTMAEFQGLPWSCCAPRMAGFLYVCDRGAGEWP
jgi:hypothetical protein